MGRDTACVMCHPPDPQPSQKPPAARSPPGSILLLQCPCAWSLSPISLSQPPTPTPLPTHILEGHFTPGLCEVNVNTNPFYSCPHSDRGILKMKMNSGSFKGQCRCQRWGFSIWESWILSSYERKSGFLFWCVGEKAHSPSPEGSVSVQTIVLCELTLLLYGKIIKKKQFLYLSQGSKF